MELFFLYSQNISLTYKSRITPLLVKTYDSVMILPTALIFHLQRLRNHYLDKFCSGKVNDAYRFEYTSGMGYIITFSAAKEIYDYGKCLLQIPAIEDVLLTGALRELLHIELDRVRLVDNYDSLEETTKNNTEELSKIPMLYSFTKLSLLQKFELWSRVENFLGKTT